MYMCVFAAKKYIYLLIVVMHTCDLCVQVHMYVYIMVWVFERVEIYRLYYKN